MFLSSRISNLRSPRPSVLLFPFRPIIFVLDIVHPRQLPVFPLLSMSFGERERSVRTWTFTHPLGSCARVYITFIRRASCCPAYQSSSQDPAQTFHRRGRPDLNLPLFSHKVPSSITHLTFIPTQVQVDTPDAAPYSTPRSPYFRGAALDSPWMMFIFSDTRETPANSRCRDFELLELSNSLAITYGRPPKSPSCRYSWVVHWIPLLDRSP